MRRLLGPVLLIPLFLAGLWYALDLLFVCDDAYISFRYVRSLVDGHGLVFNRGEYVEGYTNFLWVLELAALWMVGWHPVDASVALSLLATVGTGIFLVLIALRTPHHEWRWPIAWMALALWVSNRSVAVWATSGLETRQFTFFLVAAAWAIARWREGWRFVAIASLWLGLAEYTRPEALMIGPLMLGWYGLDALREGRLDRRGVLAAALPFGGLVLSQLLFRIVYYGEILPNTYYAKSVRPWWEAGWTFLGVLTLEHALYLLVPLAVVGTWARLSRDDTSAAIPWMFGLPIALHLARMGGDHFEFRTFDELWPFIDVLAAEGIVGLALIVARAQPRVAPAVAAVLFGATTLYATSLQRAHTRLASELSGRKQTATMFVEITPEVAPEVFWLPGMGLMVPTYNEWQSWCIEHWIGTRHREHQEFARMRVDMYGGYERFVGRDLFPEDAVAAEISVGVLPFVLPDLTVIDTKGLTDHTVARTPVERTNDRRHMAHDRQATPEYLAERGVNIDVMPMRPNRAAALRLAPYAIELAHEMWMPFTSPDHEWVLRAFADRGLVVRDGVPSAPSKGGGLGDFDEGLDGWILQGVAFEDNPTTGSRPRQRPIEGAVGGFLNSFHATERDAVVGRASSPPFVVREGDVLHFRVGGGQRPSVGVFLLDERGQVLGSWRGSRTETLADVAVSLAEHVGQQLRVEVRDDDTAGWGHIVADGFRVGAD